MNRPKTRRQFLAGASAAALAAGCRGAAVIADETGDTSIDDTADSGDSGDTQDSGDTEPTIPEVFFDADGVPHDDTLFPLAVQAGGMRPESVVIVSFCAVAGAFVLRVWQPTETEGVVRLFVDQPVVPSVEGHLKVPVSGLVPGEWFEYTVLLSDGAGGFSSRSLIGRVRTALAEQALEPLTVAMTACPGADARPWPALLQTAEHDYDLFVHLGDIAYNDGASSLAEYRASWQWYLAGAGYRDAFAQSGLYAVWDDHEVDNNWNPESIDATQLANARQTYLESMAVEEDTDGRLWMSYRWGLTAEILVLDCRSERKPSTRTGPDAEYISPAQLSWLQERLLNSPCHFKIVLNSVPITDMPLAWDAAAADRWEGYAAQRIELIDHIRDNAIANVWFLSGDFHVCFVARVEKYPLSVLDHTYEIAATGGKTNVLGATLGLDEQFSYGSSQARACLVTFDPSLDTVRVRFLDPEDGSVKHEETLSQS